MEVEDANAAIELVQYAIFRKVLEKDKKKKRQRGEDSDEEVEPLNGEEQQQPKRTRAEEVSFSHPTFYYLRLCRTTFTPID